MIEIAEGQRGLHALVGSVDADNAPSLKLLRKHGFSEVARLPEVGFKFGQWLDLLYMQRLAAPPPPMPSPPLPVSAVL